MGRTTKRRILILAALLLAIPGAGRLGRNEALSQDEKRPYGQEYEPSSFFAALDVDRDGFISRQEWAAFFMVRDADQDQRLSWNEISSVSNSSSTESSDPDAGRIAAFERLDVNRNRTIDPAEWPGKAKDYRYLDANHDRLISLEEFLAKNVRWRNMPFANLDFNGDKVISRSEWLDSDASFDKLDRDQNGVVDRVEFYEYR